MTKQIVRTYFFDSSSSDKQYQTLEYVDGSTSCDCLGWVRRVQQDGSRSCKHTRMVEADLGRRAASNVVEYSGKPFTKELRPQKIAPLEELPIRAFNFAEA